MDILRLIISILFPPIGLFVNYILGSENKLQKASTIISTVLSILLIILVIITCILIGSSNEQENDLLRCRTPYYCEESDGDYTTCYYCKDDDCNNLGSVTCVNDGQIFNYKTEAGEDIDE